MDNVKGVYESKLLWFFEHTFFVCVPLMLFTSYIGSTLFRYSALFISAIYMISVAFLMGARLSTIGLTTKYFKKAIDFIIGPTILVAIVIFLAKIYYPAAFVKPTNNTISTIFYILISVPLQEILFRGFCLWRCRLTWRSISFIILFNSILFAMYHMLFNNWYLTIGIFLINIFWSYGFMKFPNLYAFIVSHLIIGLVYFL